VTRTRLSAFFLSSLRLFIETLVASSSVHLDKAKESDARNGTSVDERCWPGVMRNRRGTGRLSRSRTRPSTVRRDPRTWYKKQFESIREEASVDCALPLRVVFAYPFGYICACSRNTIVLNEGVGSPSPLQNFVFVHKSRWGHCATSRVNTAFGAIQQLTRTLTAVLRCRF